MGLYAKWTSHDSAVGQQSMATLTAAQRRYYSSRDTENQLPATLLPNIMRYKSALLHKKLTLFKVIDTSGRQNQQIVISHLNAC